MRPYIVPGGRYLVTVSIDLFVSTVDCKLVASVGLEDDFEFCVVLCYRVVFSVAASCSATQN